MPTPRLFASSPLPGAPLIRALDAGDLIGQSQLLDPLVTDVVVSQPIRRMWFGEELFRQVRPKAIRFQYKVFGDEHRIVKDARRALRAPIQSSERKVQLVPAQMERYSWATVRDVAELDNADATASLTGGMSLLDRTLLAADSRIVVRLSIESARAAVVLDPASYSSSPDLDDTLSSGSEFNDATNGDSRVAVRSMASRLAGANGVSSLDLEAMITNETHDAIQEDPAFITYRSNGGNTASPTLEEIAKYWGIGSVGLSDAYEFIPGTGQASLYGDILVLRIKKSLSAQYDRNTGTGDSFVRFAWDGHARTAYYLDDITSWKFPWEAWELPVMVDPLAAAIIRNTAA
jgi:hypothetical protein